MSSPEATSTLTRFAGWLPAVVLPLATLDQLIHILRSNDVGGVSVVSWALFLAANIGAWTLGRSDTRLAQLQRALAFLLTAGLDLVIVAVVLWRRAS